MADQIYTADLDTRAYEKGLAGLVDRARKAGTDLQTVFAKVDARAATAGRELGTRDSGGSLTVFGKLQKEGAEEAKRATESSSESTLKHALRFGILMKAGKMAWGVARDAMDAYGQTSAFAKGEVDSLMNVFGKFQASMGQDLVAGIGGIFGPWATNPNTWKNAWESTQRGLVDLMSGSGAYDQARAAEQKQAALAAENAAQLKSLETEKTIRATMAGIVSDKSAAADFTRAEAVAAQQLRERYTEIDKLEGLRAGRKAELQALAREEYDRAAAAALQRRVEAEAEAGQALAFQRDQARADTLRANGRDAEAEAASRRLELERRTVEVLHGQGSEADKAATLAAERVRSAALEAKAQQDVRDAVRDAAQAALLGAKQSSPFYQQAAELAGKRLDAERQLEQLRRQGASEDQLRTVGLLQDQELAALPLEAARSGVKLPRSQRVAAGFSGFAGQVVGGGGGQDYGRSISDNVSKLNKQVGTISEQLRRLNDNLQGVGTLQ